MFEEYEFEKIVVEIKQYFKFVYVVVGIWHRYSSSAACFLVSINVKALKILDKKYLFKIKSNRFLKKWFELK